MGESSMTKSNAGGGQKMGLSKMGSSNMGTSNMGSSKRNVPGKETQQRNKSMGETSSFGGFKPGGKTKKTDKSKATGGEGSEDEFAEHSSQEEESSDSGTDYEALQRDQDANTYYYKCPVFRTTLRLRTGEISSDNKPV